LVIFFTIMFLLSTFLSISSNNFFSLILILLIILRKTIQIILIIRVNGHNTKKIMLSKIFVNLFLYFLNSRKSYEINVKY